MPDYCAANSDVTHRQKVARKQGRQLVLELLAPFLHRLGPASDDRHASLVVHLQVHRVAADHRLWTESHLSLIHI